MTIMTSAGPVTQTASGIVQPQATTACHGHEESRFMPVDPELLEILACPNCKTKVELVKNGTALKCGECKRVYPIKDDIPVMLLDEATVEP